MQGKDVEKSIELIQEATKERATGLPIITPYWEYLLAAIYASVGEIQDGLYTINKALEHLDQMERLNFWRPEILVLKGQLTLRPEDEHDFGSYILAAECIFQQAYELAEQQQAKLIQLRAATHLAQLWHSQGRTRDARDLLAPVYAWFSEGFNMPDLQEARALLAKLANQ